MFAGLISKIGGKLLMWGFGLAAIAGLFFYVRFLNVSIDNLKLNNSLLQNAVQEQQKTMDMLQADYRKIIQSRDTLNRMVIELRKSNDELREVLFRETQNKKSLEELILIDSKGRIERLINNATKRVFDCFEKISQNKECQ